LPYFAAHQSVVLCHGPRFDITLNGFLPKKPECCEDCGHWESRCLIGYGTSPKTPVCKQAIEKTAQRSF